MMTVTPDILGIYLGVDDINQDRATLILSMASSICVATLGLVPNAALPDAAESVVLSSAARAYVNPATQTAQMAGPYQMSGATGGVYLTKAERATLARLNGRTGAFSIDMIANYADRFDDSATS